MTNNKNPDRLFKVAEIKVTFRPKIRAADRPLVNNSSGACKILLQQWDSSTIELIEQFKVILLSWNARVLGIYEIAAGNMNAIVVDIRLIIATALKARASSIILAHNHPSGEPFPSPADFDLTKKIKGMAKIFDIRVNDHIILCRDSYFSFADEGEL